MVAIAQALYPNPNHLDSTILTKEALQKLQAGILEQCDAQDGLKDGIIQDPASVHFDLAKVPGLTARTEKGNHRHLPKGARQCESPICPGYPSSAECDPDQCIAWLSAGAGPPGPKDHVPDLTFAFGIQGFQIPVFNNPDWDYSKLRLLQLKKTPFGASFLMPPTWT